jgi:hypothetical protein
MNALRKPVSTRDRVSTFELRTRRRPRLERHIQVRCLLLTASLPPAMTTKPPPSNSLPGLSARSTETLASSGSFQRHLSQRIRPPTHARNSSLTFTPLTSIAEPKTYTTLLASVARKHLAPPSADLDLAVDAPRAPPVFSSTASAVWMFYVYAFVSLVFFSTTAYSILDASWNTSNAYAGHQDHGQKSVNVSYLSSLSTSTRLAKLVSLHPPAVEFEPFFFRSKSLDVSRTTACLWTYDDDLDWIAPWTASWDGTLHSHRSTSLLVDRFPLGPISLLVATRTSPNQRSIIYGKVSDFLCAAETNVSKLALHVLYLHTASSPAPNAFLNLARLFSPSPHVLLIPGSHAPIDPPSIPADGAPTAITTEMAPAFPYAPLAPVLLPRAHAVWCTERFFTPASPALDRARAVDWAECIWQLHLDALGGMRVTLASSPDLITQEPTRFPNSSSATADVRTLKYPRGARAE